MIALTLSENPYTGIGYTGDKKIKEPYKKDDENMLQVENLTYKVMENGKETTLLRDISFEVKDGEMLVITGPNGGGKIYACQSTDGNCPGQQRKNSAGWSGSDRYDAGREGKSGNRICIPAASGFQRNGPWNGF